MKLKLLKLLKKLSRISSRGFSRFSRFSKVLTAFVYFSSLSSISYFATTENQVLHVYKDWTGLISGDVLSSADVLSDDDIISSEPVSEDMADMAVSNDTPASSENDNEESESDSFDSFVSHDTNDTEKEADTEDSAEDTADSGNTVAPVAPVPSGPDEENNDNTPNNENNDNNPNNPNDSESIAVLTTRLTSDHHLIATLSISDVLGADVMFFPPAETINGNADNNGGEGSADLAGVTSQDLVPPHLHNPDALLLNFENEEGVVESVRLWLDNEIEKTVIIDEISGVGDSGFSSDLASTSSDILDILDIFSSTGTGVIENLQGLADSTAVSVNTGVDKMTSIDKTSNASVDVSPAYSLDSSSIDLKTITSPIIVILPDTNEQFYFADGKALANYRLFEQNIKLKKSGRVLLQGQRLK